MSPIEEHFSTPKRPPILSRVRTALQKGLTTGKTMADSKSETLLSLSPEDYEIYNALAVKMERFHDYFRETWTWIYTVAQEGSYPPSTTPRHLIRTGLDFCRHLEAHHGIEERFMFPKLAEKMPAFADELQMPDQHRQIHGGLVKLRDYLWECGRKNGETELDLVRLKAVMDGFGEVLWAHLDAEVVQLRAENMRRFWSLDDMRRMMSW